MSDQQYPYGQQPHQQPHQPGRQPHQQAQQAFQDAYAQDPYAQDPYAQDPYAPQDPYAQGPAQGSYAQGSYAQDQSAHDPYTQTWEGQTWDTQYQPVQQPYAPQATPQPQQEAPQQEAPQEAPRATPQQPYAQQPYAQQPQPQPQHQAAQQHQQYQSPPPPQSYPLPPEAPTPAPYTAQPVATAPAAVAGDGPAYSAPSTLGNARITDAQRARAEGRSPIIAPGMQPAALTAGLGVLLAVAAIGGRFAVVVPLLVLQALTAAGWFRLNGMWPARQGIALAFLGGAVADVALLVAGADHAPAAIIGTLGVWVLLTLVLQLRSHASADERMTGLMATIASSALTVVATGILAASTDAVTVGCIAVAGAVLVRALSLPGPVPVVAALVVAAVVGIVLAPMTGLSGGAPGALLGFAAGGCALIGLRVASYDYPSRFVHMTAGVALPLSAAAPAIYLIGRVIG
ncbi:hypothetical protein [Streptomyces sp. A 4/2]|uniref:hypothetical protein n=1 Tax=Streptomyces sp. A 4/2 TaxID=2934314 RepID=UPI002024AA31|nr:hypothetical protein [Streptomyces sp. A 4/2]